MSQRPYIQLVPVRLKDGVDEKTLLETSDAFQRVFVSRQPGVLKRILARSEQGGYADLVFFESKEAAERVAAAERTSEECRKFFEILQPPDAGSPDMGILSFEPLKTYESR
jgi:hypothetical protein